VYKNIIKCSGAVDAIDVIQGTVDKNSIFCSGGSGSGIRTGGIFTRLTRVITNNVVEGFSGVGGIGIESHTSPHVYCEGNAVYNCTTPYDTPIQIYDANAIDNEILVSSPFVDGPGGNFTPVDIGNVKEGEQPPTVGL
jgi:hypothetical protein